MSTIVVRPKPQDRKRAAAEGWTAETMIAWPDDAVSAERRFPGDMWVFTTRQDVRQRKIALMEARIRAKRHAGPQRRALLVWVFFIHGDLFGGWWTYLIGISGHCYYGGGYKRDVGPELMARLMELFPLGLPGVLSGDQWMEAFAAKYAKPGRRRQAFAPVWATVDGDLVVSIDCRARRLP